MGKYLAYPEYKSTGVEWFPDAPAGWGVLTARRVFKQVRDPANPDDEQLAATQKYGVIPQRLFMEYQDQKVVLALAGTGNFKHVEINDFVISLRSFQGGIERCHYEGCVSPAYTVMRRDKAIDPAYFSFLLKSEGFITALQSVTQGIREGKTITYEQFGSISVPFPTMGEQQHIAAFLDHETAKIDRLIAKQERLIELLKEKRQAVISHVVTKGLNPNAPMKDSGVEWLGEVPAHWEVSRLKFVVRESVAGPYGSSLTKSMYSNEGYRVYGQQQVIPDDFSIGDYYISDEKFAEMSRYQVHPGDVLVSVMGTIGRAAVVPDDVEPGIINPRLVRYKPLVTRILPRFMQRLILSHVCQAQLSLAAQGSTMEGLNMRVLGELPFPLPSLEEQGQILDYVAEKTRLFDRTISATEKAVSLLKEHRTALISAAVTGKIDVRGWQQPNNETQEAATAASA